MIRTILAVMLVGVLCAPGTAISGTLSQVDQVEGDARCPVCGMFVAKYENWLAQLRLSNGGSEPFDGVKDMMVYYFSPQDYGLAPGLTVTEVQVKDYYSQNWIDGRSAFYVTGSDVLGPMGHEFIPFEKLEGAENFMKDHHGKEIVEFSAITPEMVESMRKGHKMKGHIHHSK